MRFCSSEECNTPTDNVTGVDFAAPRINGCPIPPDFLLSPVGLTSFMRLSSMKAARAVTDRAAYRKSGHLARFREMWETRTLIWVTEESGRAKEIPDFLDSTKQKTKTFTGLA
jgi:hypothetical protein